MTNTQAIKATHNVAIAFLIVVVATLALVLTSPSIQVDLGHSVILNTTGLVNSSTIVDHQGVSTAVIDQVTSTDTQFGIDNGKVYTDTYHF